MFRYEINKTVSWTDHNQKIKCRRYFQPSPPVYQDQVAATLDVRCELWFSIQKMNGYECDGTIARMKNIQSLFYSMFCQLDRLINIDILENANLFWSRLTVSSHGTI